MFGNNIDDAIKTAAIVAYPREMCGVVHAGRFVVLQNVATNPLKDFELAADAWIKYAPVSAVVHSHPTQSMESVAPGFLPDCPSSADMRSQMATNVPWGIVVTDGKTAGPPRWWGEELLNLPLLGRPFRHGITDCYGAVRSWFFQKRGVRLPEQPRDCSWWEDGKTNLYLDGYEAAGFKRVGFDSAIHGDVLLMQIGRTKTPNHSAVYLGNNLIYHHPMPMPSFGRAAAESLSRNESIGSRRPYVTHVLRYVGK